MPHTKLPVNTHTFLTPSVSNNSNQSPGKGSTEQNNQDQQSNVDSSAVRVHEIDFFYRKIQALYKISFALPKGCRCLLVGDNGAGKTTLLKLLAGKTSTVYGDITVLGEPATFSPYLNLKRAYMGGDWGKKIVPFAGVTALTADIAVKEMMQSLQAQFPKRRAMLFDLLQIDENWRMHQVSDGQRRRVQIMLNLLRPVDILFADEITTDLDVVTRMDLMAFLRKETEERGMSIVYTTHIFDGLDGWATHIAYLAAGNLVEFGPIDKWPGLNCPPTDKRCSSLMGTLAGWIRRDRQQNLEKYRECFDNSANSRLAPDGSAGGYAPGRMGMVDLTLKPKTARVQ